MLAPIPRAPDVEAALAAAYEILQAATTVLEALTAASSNATERDTSRQRDSS
jgi:uncharacterized protein with LGFP repeats